MNKLNLNCLLFLSVFMAFIGCSNGGPIKNGVVTGLRNDSTENNKNFKGHDNNTTEDSKPPKKALQMNTKNLTARQYSLQNQEYSDLPYSRKYSNAGGKFITTYQTYNPNSGNAIHKITVVYDPISHQIKVNVKAVFGGVFAPDDLNYKLKVTDEFKTINPWGEEGSYRRVVGSGVPYETLVQFATQDFTYVNLLQVKSEDDHGEVYWYFLDEPLRE